MTEITLNPIQYLFSLMLTEALVKPVTRFFGVLGVVASVYTVAKWNDVSWNRARTIRRRQGYPMIRRNCMPQPRRTPTDSAATFEISKRVLPISNSKSIRQVAFA